MKKFGEKLEGVEYKKRTGSYGVLVKDGRAGVISRKDYDTYFLTGGGIEEGEDERATIRREALEEIGVELEVGERLGEAVQFFYLAGENEYIAQECRFYRAFIKGEKKGGAKYELVWIDRNELAKMHHECYRWILENELIVLG
jgi:8-oxo-dGTP diphosphatase